MSLLSPQVGIVAPSGQSGPAPIQDVYAKLTVATAVFFVMLELSYLVMAGLPPIDKPWVDAANYVFGNDFLNTWMGGRSVFFGGPAPWFDAKTYNDTLHQMLGAPYPDRYWSYPPDVMLFIWPFGLLPYVPAYFVWCAAGIALYLLACRRAIPNERLLFLAVAPGIAACIFFGQNGFYTAALLIGGLLCLDRRPVLAGVLFGILTIKPQLGLLLPVMLLLERRWLTIASAVVTTALLVAATSLWFGWHVWVEFLEKVVPQQAFLTETGRGLLLVMVSSIFYGARLLHVPNDFAWMLQWIVSALAFAAVVWTYWKRRDPALSLALLVTATFLFTPYVLNYDMVVFGFVVALLRDRADNTERDHQLLIVLWLLPIMMMLAAAVFIPLAQIVQIAFACRLLWRLKRAGEVQTRPILAHAVPAVA